MILRYFILRYNQRDGMGSGYPRSLVQHAIRGLSANGCVSTYKQRSFGMPDSNFETQTSKKLPQKITLKEPTLY